MKSFVIIFSVIAIILRKASCVNHTADSQTCSVRKSVISDQSQLDLFITDISLYDNSSKCIHLSLIGGSFKVDLLQLMRIHLGTNGSLVIKGDSVNIQCSINVTDLEELRNILRPISRSLLVLFDGLTFTNCPVPIVIEEVSTVIIQNCVFL